MSRAGSSINAGNYNEGMFAIRYVALLSLVVWLGGMIWLGLFGTPTPELLSRFHLAQYVCGFVVLVCLFAIKFIGPPPHGFIPRVAIVVLMLLIAVASGFQFNGAPGALRALTALNLALGLVLLYWYVNE
jgi:hypothetical protein